MLLGQMYRLGLGMSADAIEAYAWSEVASLEGSVFAKRERDASLGKLDGDKQEEAVAHAAQILNQTRGDRSCRAEFEITSDVGPAGSGES